MNLMRLSYLPQGPSRGRLIVPQAVALHTLERLKRFKGFWGKHEGLLYWLGRRQGEDALVVGGYLPDCIHDQHRVDILPVSVGNMIKKARKYGLSVVAQIHTHAGTDTRHSDGDDKMVLMPYEGMYSLVVGKYGKGGITLEEGLGLHQYQDGTWVQITRQHGNPLVIVPNIINGADI